MRVQKNMQMLEHFQPFRDQNETTQHAAGDCTRLDKIHAEWFQRFFQISEALTQN